MSSCQYKAFISYSHKDSKIASWLLKKLETYRFPLEARAKNVQLLGANKSRLGSFFRDRENLSAGDSIESSIFTALAKSEYLIVVCSPNSAVSQRVDAEVREFIRTRDSQKVLCLIVDGEPGISRTIGGDAKLECFSPTLLHLLLTHDPLAADVRAPGDGKKLALSKLVAGLTDTDLTRLLRTEQRRRHARLAVAASIFGAVVISLAGFGYRAKVAEDMAIAARIEAELQTERAEGFAEYLIDEMIASRLHEVGRIDALDSAIQQVISYYSEIPEDRLSVESLSRKTRAFNYLGDAYMRQGKPGQAEKIFRYALNTSKTLVNRSQSSADGALAYMTSLSYWARYLVRVGDLEGAEAASRERLRYTENFLAKYEPNYLVLDSHASQHVHLGSVLMQLGKVAEAEKLFVEGLQARKAMVNRFPDMKAWPNNVAGAYHHLAWAQSHLGNHQDAVANERESNRRYFDIYESDRTDQRDRSNLARSYRWLAEALSAAGRYGEAMTEIQQSLSLHKGIVADDPTDENRRLQSCLSAVVGMEVASELKHKEQIAETLDTYCPASWGVISPAHFNAKNRLLDLRLQLVRAEYSYTDAQYTVANGILRELSERIERETERGQMPDPEVEMLHVGLKWLDVRLDQHLNHLDEDAGTTDLALSTGFRRHPRTIQVLEKIDAFQEAIGTTHLSR